MPLMWNGDEYEYVPSGKRRSSGLWAYVIVLAWWSFVIWVVFFAGLG